MGKKLPITSDKELSEKDLKFIDAPKVQQWLSKSTKNYQVENIHIKDIAWFGPNLGFLYMDVTAYDSEGNWIPGLTLIRGGCVAILVILKCAGKKYALFVKESRIPAGEDVAQPPAGMIDDHEFKGALSAAIRELEEETGIKITRNEIICLTDETKQTPCYTSPGTTDETIISYLVEKDISPDQIKIIEDTMVHTDEGEHIKRICIPLKDVPKQPSGIAKQLWCDYQLYLTQFKEDIYSKIDELEIEKTTLRRHIVHIMNDHEQISVRHHQSQMLLNYCLVTIGVVIFERFFF
tara:strand:+ start:238 stop:1116 length:879 start_codon:yes stop_codon:yes gene_type:complete